MPSLKSYITRLAFTKAAAEPSAPAPVAAAPRAAAASELLPKAPPAELEVVLKQLIAMNHELGMAAAALPLDDH